MFLGMNFLMFLEVLRTFKGFFADLWGGREKISVVNRVWIFFKVETYLADVGFEGCMNYIYNIYIHIQ
jgi:hypothetical protein